MFYLTDGTLFSFYEGNLFMGNEFQFDPQAAQAAQGAVMFIMAIYLALIILIIASLWKIFSKAGQPGWAAIIPIYNLVVMIQIAGKPVWWIVLFFIPIISIIPAIMIPIEIAKKFGKGVGFGLGLIFLPFIFYPVLAFGSAQYEGADEK